MDQDMKIDTVIFEKQLEYVKAKTYDEILSDLKAFSLLPVTSEVPEWATEMTWRSYKGYGVAKFIADMANDYPLAEVGGSELSRKIWTIAAGYDYSEKELIRAAHAGVPLDTKKAAAARRAIESKLDSIAWNGDTAHNIPGFLSYPGITEYTVPSTGTGASKKWAAKTSDQILTDLYGIGNAIETATGGKEKANTILIPRTQYQLIKQKRLSDYSEKTVLQYFLDMNPGVTVDYLDTLSNKGTGNVARMIAYDKNVDKLSFEVPQVLVQKEVYRTGVNKWLVPMEASTAGVIVYRVLSVAFGDDI
jgi:hypothetical protein